MPDECGMRQDVLVSPYYTMHVSTLAFLTEHLDLQRGAHGRDFVLGFAFEV